MAALDGVISRCSHTSNVARIGPAAIHYFVGWVARNGFNHRMCRASLTRRGWLRVLRLASPVLRTLMAQSRKDLDLSMPALQMADGRARRLHTSMGARHLD